MAASAPRRIQISGRLIAANPSTVVTLAVGVVAEETSEEAVESTCCLFWKPAVSVEEAVSVDVPVDEPVEEPVEVVALVEVFDLVSDLSVSSSSILP